LRVEHARPVRDRRAELGEPLGRLAVVGGDGDQPRPHGFAPRVVLRRARRGAERFGGSLRVADLVTQELAERLRVTRRLGDVPRAEHATLEDGRGELGTVGAGGERERGAEAHVGELVVVLDQRLEQVRGRVEAARLHPGVRELALHQTTRLDVGLAVARSLERAAQLLEVAELFVHAHEPRDRLGVAGVLRPDPLEGLGGAPEIADFFADLSEPEQRVAPAVTRARAHDRFLRGGDATWGVSALGEQPIEERVAIGLFGCGGHRAARHRDRLLGPPGLLVGLGGAT
jgi:hypothetical protein